MNIINLFEFLALACSIFSLHKANPSSLRLLITAIVITLAAEITGYYVRIYLHKSNHNIFNLSVVVIIFILLHLFEKVVCLSQYKKIVKVFMGILIAFSIVNFVFIQGINRFATYNYILGGTLLCFAVCFYFIELLKMPIKMNLLNEPFFWLGAGIILMYIPKTILYSIFEYLSYSDNLGEPFTATFAFLNTILSVIFYISISIACTCRLIFRR
jgi:drug/metabolite transporter superfamily protein YnfA